MPIKPPNLDDRRYEDIIAEMMQLVPQYCPEWTNLGAADPGVTLVQLFSWMTEMILYRVNRVPEKTYIHFLNFIGEDRRPAQPSVAPITFSARIDQAIEVPAFTTCATRQTEERQALNFLTVEPLTVHSAQIQRIVAVKADERGEAALVRDIPFQSLYENPAAIQFAKGQGIQLFEMDPIKYGGHSYTDSQYIYVAHYMLEQMNIELGGERPVGSIFIRAADDERLSFVDLFEWEYPSSEGWLPIANTEVQTSATTKERAVVAAFPGIIEDQFDVGGVNSQLPNQLQNERYWIRGRLNYEQWIERQMQDDLSVSWLDDRGQIPRQVSRKVHSRGRTLEFELPDLPPMRMGWQLKFEMVNRRMDAGRQGYFPLYQWYYRRGEDWEAIPSNQVHQELTTIIIEGPLTDMVSDGINLKAERIESVDLQRLCRQLDLELSWNRPIEQTLMMGDKEKLLEELESGGAPWDPFQINPVIPPTIGRKFFIGSDLFINASRSNVTLELEYCFEQNGEEVTEPIDNYALQLSYRAEDSWRLVWTEDKKYNKFRFNDLQADTPPQSGRQKVRITLDQENNLKGITSFELSKKLTGWLRFELVKSNLMGQDEDNNEFPIRLRIYDLRIGMGSSVDRVSYVEPMSNPRVIQLDYRPENERLTQIIARHANRSNTFYPFHPFIEIENKSEPDPETGERSILPVQSLYIHLDRPLPVGNRHAIQFRCRGEAFLPEEIAVDWEVLEDMGRGRFGWRKLSASEETEQGEILPAYALNRTGTLEFPLAEEIKLTNHGMWLRGNFSLTADQRIDDLPALPPLSHVLLNTTNAINLNTQRTERYSGQGIPNQQIELLRKPIFLHENTQKRGVFVRPDRFPDIRVFIEQDGQREQWQAVSDAEMLIAGKDDPVFTVDPVDGVLTFGNGIRGRILPYGSSNVIIDLYRVVVGNKGNVAPFDIEVCDRISSVDVANLLPANGGRDAETVEEIVQRAPSLLTTRDRAVTASDFELISMEASSEVARASCNGKMDDDGLVQVVVLPHRRKDEQIPNPFLSEGLRDHVSSYLKSRCLINVQPEVRLAKFMRIDISIRLRLRPKSNLVQAREVAEAWVLRFLDPYTGGLDQTGWPFGGTLYGQDLARMVSDLPELRHIMAVQLYDVSDKDKRSPAGWETGSGADELRLVEHDLFNVRRIRVEIGE